MKREHRLLNRRRGTDFSQSSGHIVQDNLNRKNGLLQKYQTQMLEAHQMIEKKQRMSTNRNTLQSPRHERSLNKSRLNIKLNQSYLSASSPSLNDYQKLILGLEYSLQAQRKKNEGLSIKNQSLQTQISNLRNVFVNNNELKNGQSKVYVQYQKTVGDLQRKIQQQKANYDFIIDSKNESLANLQFELRTLQKKIKQQQKDAFSKKILQLMNTIQQLRTIIVKKNIIIQRIKYHKEQPSDSQSEDQIQQKLISMNINKKMEFYNEQIQISNKFIIKKNIQLLNVNKRLLFLQDVIDVIEQYIDKKQVKNVNISVLQHSAVNKLRVLLRQKAVFQKQLLNQLNEHNKKIGNFQNQIANRDNVNSNKIIQVVNDNKRLSSLVTNLQNNIANLQKNLYDEKREQQLLRNQIQINKKQFVDEVKKLKDQITTISSVTKNQFDRMKMENTKLAQQNKLLVFMMNQKQKELNKKGQAIKTFQNFKQKINSLASNLPQKQAGQSVNSQDAPQLGTKLVLINTFGGWWNEWNKIKNWNNKKVLLNIILDKQQIRDDAVPSIANLITALHQSLLNSKNTEVEDRAIILLSLFLKHHIIKNPNLFVDRVAPVVVRGLRPPKPGQDQQRIRILNESALRIISTLQRNEFRWTQSMSNEIISINGLKYIFSILQKSQIDELVECAYNSLTMISKANQMISFVNSYNVTTLILNNLNKQYPFIIYLLNLLKIALQNREYLKAQRSLLDFKKLFNLLKDDDEEIADLSLDCLLNLMQNSMFVKGIGKIQNISILCQLIRMISSYSILKKAGEAYAILVGSLQSENEVRLVKQVDKLIDVLKTKKYNENRFNRALRMILKTVEMISGCNDLDQRVILNLGFLYQKYDLIQVKSRAKLNMIINIIYQRNKQVINKFINDQWITNIIQAYQQANNNQQIAFLLKIMQNMHDQKRTTQILRTGRQNLISKLVADSLYPDYNAALPALKNLLAISKQKYSQKFINKNTMHKIVNKVLLSRNQQDFISTTIGILYFFCKIQDVSLIVIECGIVEILFTIITQKYDKQTLVFKCLTLLQLCHTTNYKKKILNYIFTHDQNLQMLKIVNFALKQAKKKQQMGTRAIFIYDFLSGKTSIQSLSHLMQQNLWMVDDLVSLRNDYIKLAQSLVYKIQMLLHNLSSISPKIRKAYEKFRVQGHNESDDD